MITKKKFLSKKKYLVKKNITPRKFEKFKFVWINSFNQDTYLKNRNKEMVSKFFYNKKINTAEHSSFIKNYLNLPRIDFIIIKNKQKFVGLINLKFKNRYFEIGKFISNRTLQNKGIMSKAFINFIDYLIRYIKIKYIYSETLKSNKKNIKFNLKNNFKIVKKTKKIILMRKKIY